MCVCVCVCVCVRVCVFIPANVSGRALCRCRLQVCRICRVGKHECQRRYGGKSTRTATRGCGARCRTELWCIDWFSAHLTIYIHSPAFTDKPSYHDLGVYLLCSVRPIYNITISNTLTLDVLRPVNQTDKSRDIRAKHKIHCCVPQVKF